MQAAAGFYVLLCLFTKIWPCDYLRRVVATRTAFIGPIRNMQVHLTDSIRATYQRKTLCDAPSRPPHTNSSVVTESQKSNATYVTAKRYSVNVLAKCVCYLSSPFQLY